MLNDNIKNLRKQKGMTQEELAVRLHVVRQTVSKWEKGLSVPDAETLQKIAQELEVNVNELLGAEIKYEDNRNEIADQLARINEQLAVQNRRTGRIIKTIAIVLAIFVIGRILLVAAGVTLYSHHKTGYATSYSMNEADPVYSENEVKAAMDAVESFFNKNMKGCELLSIDYDEDYSVAQATLESRDYGDKDVIVLSSSFHTDKNGGDGSMAANTDYDGWNWILVKNDNGKWEVVNYGY